MEPLTTSIQDQLQSEYDRFVQLKSDPFRGPGDTPLDMYRAFDRFTELARQAFREEIDPTRKAAMHFQLDNLTFTRNKEVSRAQHSFQQAKKPRAAKKRLSEYYDAEGDAKYMMDVEMRGFLSIFQEQRTTLNP